MEDASWDFKDYLAEAEATNEEDLTEEEEEERVLATGFGLGVPVAGYGFVGPRPFFRRPFFRRPFFRRPYFG